jgi:hypothetical protein
MTTYAIFQGFTDMDATANAGEFILRFGLHLNKSGDGPDAVTVTCSVVTTFESADVLTQQVIDEIVKAASREGFQIDGSECIIMPVLQKLPQV